MFSMGSDNYFGTPDLVPNSGMLQADAYHELEPMDQSEEEEEVEDALGTGADEIEHLDLLIFPASKAPLETNDKGQFRLRVEHIPINFVSIPPHVMKAVSHYDDEMSKQKATIASHACMPGIVHTSPMVSLFSSVAVIPAGQRPPPGGIQRAWHNKYTSFVFSMYQLKQLFISVTGGLIPFNKETFNEEKMQKVFNEFEMQVKIMNRLQDEQLDRIYTKAVEPGTAPDYMMHEFIALLEKYSFQLIHLYEYLIWTVAVQPRCDMPLEALLTPMDLPILSQCSPQEQQRCKEDVNMFFNYKIAIRDAQEAENTAKGVESVDIRPNVVLVKDSATQPTSLRYKELIPLRTLYEYFFYLDTDGVLSKYNWSWKP